MKSTIKFAALGACALAATSTAALAQEIPSGFTAGIDLASPLPTGIYAIDINAANPIGSSKTGQVGTVYAAIPGLIWSSPWEIAGGKVGMTGLFAYGSFNDNAGLVTTPGGTADGAWASVVEANIKWNFGALSVSENAGIMYLFGTGNFLIADLNGQKDNTNFVGHTDFTYKFGGGLEGLLNIKYGNANLLGDGNPSVISNGAWISFEGALLKHFGKMEVGPLLVYSTDLSGPSWDQTYVGAKVGYAFDGFNADFRVLQTVNVSAGAGTGALGTGQIEDTKVFVDFVKPLWVAEESLK
ncbi:MAG: hypothetical protein WA384_18810 [Rhodomicrobium sp.]